MTPFARQLADRPKKLPAADSARMHTELAQVFERYGRAEDAKMHRRLAATFEAAARQEAAR